MAQGCGESQPVGERPHRDHAAVFLGPLFNRGIPQKTACFRAFLDLLFVDEHAGRLRQANLVPVLFPLSPVSNFHSSLSSPQ